MKAALLLIFLMAGCYQAPPEGTPIAPYRTVIIDGCEYLEFSDHLRSENAVYAIAHKGNCTNHVGIILEK